MKLADYLTENKITHKAFADDLGVSQVTVTRYAGGERFPRPKHLHEISRLTNGAVTPNDFLETAADPEPQLSPEEAA